MVDQQFLARMHSLGTPEIIGGNRFFQLDDPKKVWFIANGHVDVFSVRTENGVATGARSYFFSAENGEALFGINRKEYEMDRTLIAVPSPNTEIIMIDVEDFHQLMQEPEFDRMIIAMYDGWIGQLSQAISKDINPKTDLLIEVDQFTEIRTNLKIKAKRGIVWIEMLEGSALFLGMKETAGPHEKLLFPVSRDSWLHTVESSKVKSMTTGQVILVTEFRKYLDNFYKIIFFCDFYNIRLNAVDEFNRLNEKSLQLSRKRSAAFYKIVSVIDKKFKQDYAQPGDDPLVTACRLVAKPSGISVSLPGKTDTNDSSPPTLSEILRFSGIKARKVKISGNWWKHDNGPLLAFTRDGDFPVALIQKKTGQYEYISPGEKIIRPMNDNAAGTLKEQAYQFYRPFPDQTVTGYHLIRFGLRNASRDFLSTLIAGLVIGLLSLLVPIITGTIFDSIIPNADRRQLYVYLLIIFSSAVVMVLFQLVRNFAMIRIETRIDFSLQSAVWDRLLNLPVSFFRKFQAGELASKANSIMKLRKILSETVIYSILASIFMFFNLFLLYYYAFDLALILTVLLGSALIIIIMIGRRIEKKQSKIINLQNKVYGMLIQFLSSISKIKIAGAEVHVFSLWADKFSDNKRQVYDARKLYLTINLITVSLPLIITLIVFGFIAGQVPETLSVGQFMAFYSALVITLASFVQLSMAGISFFTAIPLLENIRPILETLPENASYKAELQNLNGEIEVSDVSFRYNPEGPMVLSNVSLQIQPGEFVAIVGASGSGKSTLLRLLLGFESPATGSIYYDRQESGTIDPASIRREAGTVLQHSQLLSGTILSNITGMTGATFEDAWEAARNVGLDEDIKQMPMGMYTVVTGGLSTLSGGQRQRIMIARAIVNKPRIIFFDEATSALDNNTQQIVSESLEKLQATRIVIAHRLTTVQNADRIYVMDHGKIVEQGTYQDLIQHNGKFAELVQRQRID